MPEQPEPTSPPRPDENAKLSQREKDKRWWKRWLLLLLLLGVASCSALDGSLRGMLSLSFDLGEDIRNIIGDDTVTGTQGTGQIEVAAPGGGAPGGASGQGNNGQGNGAPAGGTTGTTGAGTTGATGGQQGGASAAGGNNGQQGAQGGQPGAGASSAGVSAGGSPGGNGQAGGPASPGGSAGAGNASSAQSQQGAGGPGGTGGGPGGPSTPPPPPPAPQPHVVTVALIGRNGNVISPDFHFEAGSARLVLDERRFTPGFYTLRVSRYDPNTGVTQTAEQAFAWGVLALNTDKDRYRPGETGRIDIGVLDELGEIVCDADLTLTITRPDGTITQLSTDEGTIDVTGTCGIKQVGLLTPDYTTEFTYGQAGAYQLLLEAVRPSAASNQVSTLTSTVQVVTSAPYIVKRAAATRLYPFGPSTMDIEVEFLEDYAGDVTDIVPDGFQILGVDPAASSFQTPQGDTKIQWSGVWEAGQAAEFGYLYDAPDISPEFYLIGPLTFDPDDGPSSEELRQWQIANDAESRATTYEIVADVQPAGGGEPGKSTNYLIADTIGEANIGAGKSDNYGINAGYRQTSLGSYISMGCTDVVNIGSISFAGTATNDATCTVTTDSDAGYRLSWRGGVNNNDGLIGYWPLDETSGTTAYDMSGYGNAGTHQNTPTITQDVPSQYFSTRAVDMDSASSEFIVTDNLDRAVSQKTMSAWVKLGSTSQQGGGLITLETDDGSVFDSIVYNETSNGWGFGSDNYNRTAWSGVSESSTDAWVHMAATYDDNDYKLYRNGRLILRTTSFTAYDFPGNVRVLLGKRHTGGSSPYLGAVIDDARLYGRVLSAEEIRTLASLAPPNSLTQSGSQTVHVPPISYPATGGLMGHWRLDEPASMTAADASGRDNDGTPNGASGTNNKPQPSTNVSTTNPARSLRSLSFDGTDDYVSFTSPFSNTQTAVSYSVWVNGTPTFKVALSLGTEVWIGTLGGKWAWNTKPGQYMQSTANVSSGWHHLVGTHNGSVGKLYVDGVEVASANGTLGDLSGNGRIGDYSGGSYNWPGYLDDARVYNYALSAEEVKALAGIPQTWAVASTETAWGGRLKSSSTDTDSKWGTDSSSEKFMHVGDGEYSLVTRLSANHPTGSTETIQFKAEVGATAVQQPGTYRSVVLITATAL